MKNNSIKKDYSLIFKIISIIFILGYISFFIFKYITTDFNLDKNFFKTILFFILIIIFCCCLITKRKVSIFFSIISWLLILLLVFSNIEKLIPNPIKNENNKNELKKITCSGSTDTSDNTIIDIDYTNDKISKIIYTYTFDIDKQDGAQNLVNRFDKMYSDFVNIYSEIEISDNVVVKTTYKLNNVDIDKIKEIDEDFTNSYKEFKKKNLKDLACKNRD